MIERIPTDQLYLSQRRPEGQLLVDSPKVRRRLQDHGFSQPIPVRRLIGGGGFEVLGQVREYLAAVRLGLATVPALLLHDLDDNAADQLIHASYTLSFDDPIEEAECYAEKLADTPDDVRSSISRLARLTGKNRIYLSRTLALLRLHPEVQRYITAGKLTRTHARHLAKVRPLNRQLQIAQQVVRDGLSERALAARVAGRTSKPSSVKSASLPARAAADPQSKDPDTLRLERHVTELLGAPFEIDSAAGVCTIRYFRDLDTLAGVLDRLGYRE